MSDLVRISFTARNLHLISIGLKTTTLRSPAQAAKINLKVGHTGVMQIRGVRYRVTHVGLLNVDEAGGRRSIWNSEGFDYTGEPMFAQTMEFLDGNRKLHLYRFERIW